MVASYRSLVKEAETIFGPRLASAIYWHRVTDLPRLSSLDEQIVDLKRTRSLHEGVRIANEMQRVLGNSSIRAWFVGRNPLLGDQMPALVVATEPERVMNAAKSYVDL